MAAKKLYILNPHRDDFIWEPLYYKFIKRRPLKKYNYIADLQKSSDQIVLVADDRCSGLIPQSILNLMPAVLRKFLIRKELNHWKNLNDLTDVPIHWTSDSLSLGSEDSVFLFQLFNLQYILRLKPWFEKFKNTYIHLSHYYLDPVKISAITKNIENVKFCGDSDVSAHPFFTKYFSWYKKPMTLTPFFIQDRFKISVPYTQRNQKVISTGTFHYIEKYPESMYLNQDLGVNAFHYNRRNLFEKKSEFATWLTCMNSPWQQADGGWFMKLIRSRKVAQKDYFKIDLVEEYNKHQFAIIGEEICGFPGIGSFEAMACGCVVFLNPDSVKGIIPAHESCYLSLNTFLNETHFEECKKNSIWCEQASLQAAHFVEQHLRSEHCVQRFKAHFL